MEAKENIQANGRTVPAWRTIGRAAVATALASTTFLAVWSPTSAGVTQAERSSSEIVLGSAFLAGGSDHNDRAREADRLARDQGEWLRAAHGKVAITAEEQPLPPQF